MRFKAKTLKRKAKSSGSAGKKARSKLRKLKLWTKVKESEARVRNNTLLDVFNQVAEAAGEDAPKLFNYNAYHLTKKQQAERLRKLFYGSSDAMEAAVNKIEENQNEQK
jgi:hypothetical protein